MTSAATGRLLASIARDLSAQEVVFPTCFNVTLQLHQLLRDPDLAIPDLAKLLVAEPVICAKLINLANSAANAPSRPITDVASAITRVGLQTVRTVAFVVSLEQMRRSRHLVPYQDFSNRIWEHSLYVAVLAAALAKRGGKVKPDEALFVGLVHDVGAFYLLFRGAEDAELAADREALETLVKDWHDDIGHALLSAMGQPDVVLDAVQQHEAVALSDRLDTLTQVIAVADALGHRRHTWRISAGEAGRSREVENFFDIAAQEEIYTAADTALEDLKSALGAAR